MTHFPAFPVPPFSVPPLPVSRLLVQRLPGQRLPVQRLPVYTITRLLVSITRLPNYPLTRFGCTFPVYPFPGHPLPISSGLLHVHAAVHRQHVPCNIRCLIRRK